MGYETLQLAVKRRVATLTLDRPKVLNALNAAMLRELDEAMAELTADDEVGVVLLTGAGDKAFAAGADIAELAEADAKSGEQLALRGQGVFGRIARMYKPTIACIDGFALGGGCELAMACTLRLASERARLGQPEIKLGIIPGYGGTQRLPRLVGQGAALKMILTGGMVDAAEALRIGLVDEVVAGAKAQLMERARELAELIAAMPPLAVRAAIDAVEDGADGTLADGLRLETAGFGRLCGTEDKREGTAAFLEKRAAVWVGR
jgi:enoyl-CoA hydratase